MPKQQRREPRISIVQLRKLALRAEADLETRSHERVQEKAETDFETVVLVKIKEALERRETRVLKLAEPAITEEYMSVYVDRLQQLLGKPFSVTRMQSEIAIMW